MSNFETPLSDFEHPPFLKIYHFPGYNWSKVAKTVSSVVNIHFFKLWGGTIEPILNYKHCISLQALSIPGKPPGDLSTLHILILFQEFIKIVELVLRVQDISLLYHFLRFFCSCQQKIICPLHLIPGKIFTRRNFWTPLYKCGLFLLHRKSCSNFGSEVFSSNITTAQVDWVTEPQYASWFFCVPGSSKLSILNKRSDLGTSSLTDLWLLIAISTFHSNYEFHAHGEYLDAKSFHSIWWIAVWFDFTFKKLWTKSSSNQLMSVW